MLQHLIIWFSLYYLSYGLLHEVKNKEKIQTFSPKSGRDGRLQEVPNKVICLGNFWYFWKLVAEEPVVAYETWSQPEVRLYVFYLGKLHWYSVSVCDVKTNKLSFRSTNAPTNSCYSRGETQSEQQKARITAWEILVQYLLSAFQYPVENNMLLKVFPHETLIFNTLLRVIGNVHENIITESPLNLMIIKKRLTDS